MMDFPIYNEEENLATSRSSHTGRTQQTPGVLIPRIEYVSYMREETSEENFLNLSTKITNGCTELTPSLQCNKKNQTLFRKLKEKGWDGLET